MLPIRAALLAFAATLAAAATAQPAPMPAPATTGPAMMGAAQAPLPRKLPPERLAAMLRHGGYILLMRHTNSPNARPEAAMAAPGNATLERQLDAKGHADALSFGAALKRIGIRFSAVHSSPTFRAHQVAADAGLSIADSPSFLDAPTQGAGEAAAAALSALLRQPQAKGSNALVITHFPNVTGVLGPEGRGLGEGDAAVIKPMGNRFILIGALSIADWPTLGRRGRGRQ
jgi:phosphohistidine phosphatase SixA